MKKTEIIECLYKSQRIKQLVSNIAAEGFEDDLKQELFMILLDMPDEKIESLHSNHGLHFYIARILMNMTSKRKVGNFYKLFNSNQKKVEAYKRFLDAENMSGYCQSCVVPAVELLKCKMQGDAYQAHEAIIFNQYIEKRSCEKVAVFFDIPVKHVYHVVSKVKSEAKKSIIDAINS